MAPTAIIPKEVQAIHCEEYGPVLASEGVPGEAKLGAGAEVPVLGRIMNVGTE